MNKAYRNLYLGDVNDADNPKQLNQKNITHILNLSGTTTETKTAPSYDIIKEREYVHIPIADSGDNKESTMKRVLKVADMLHQEAENINGNLLIHCSMGISRSVAVMSLNNKEFLEDNVHRIKKVKAGANPEPGMVAQLNELTREMINE